MQIDLIADPDLRARIAMIAAAAAALGPACETVITRLCVVVPLADGGSAEVSADEGEIRAGPLAAPIHEVELGLIAGGTDLLFALAQDLFAKGGLRFSPLSKADRGRLLAREGRIERAPFR